MRGRSYSYSPSPSPTRGGYRERRRSPSPRGRDLPTSLLVRNLSRHCRPDDLRDPFGEFGPLKDIYLPRDYYTGEPRGFGFVEYVYPADAEEAKYHMDGQTLLGRELTVVFAEQSRKKPSEMRVRTRHRDWSYDRKHSPVYYSRSQRSSYSRSSRCYSPSPRRRHYSRSVSRDDRSYDGRHYSRSPSPPSPRCYSRGSRHCSSPSPIMGRRRYSRSVSSRGSYRERRSYSRSLRRRSCGGSPGNGGRRSYSRSPSPSPSPSPVRSPSPSLSQS